MRHAIAFGRSLQSHMDLILHPSVTTGVVGERRVEEWLALPQAFAQL